MNSTQGIKGRYEQLAKDRQPFLDRARECSKYTIPTLIPPEGANKTTQFSTPYQGLGARGVNNLASKLLLALFPPSTPFFRLLVEEDKIKAQLDEDDGLKTNIEKALSKMERKIIDEIEAGNSRIGVYEGLKHLITSGNVLLVLPDDGGLRVFHLDRYVVKRDPQGLVLEIITKESTVPQALSEKIRALVFQNDNEYQPDKTRADLEKTVDIFTKIERGQTQWIVTQEINGVELKELSGTYPITDCPWIPLRWCQIDNEDYGRGYVEEYLGDIISLEELTKAIVQGSVASAKVLFLINANGTTKAKALKDANNGDFVTGNANDITTLQLEKFADFRVALESIEKISERLAYAFMLNMAVQRQAERVTAEEIRFMANELESGLGGVYSILSQEMQLPFLYRIMSQLTKKGKLPQLPKGAVKPVIITGIEALSRNTEQQKMMMLIESASAFGEAGLRYFNLENYLKRSASNIGLDAEGLIRSAEEIAEEDAQAEQDAKATEASQTLLNKGADYAKAMNEIAMSQPNSQTPTE